MRYVAETEWVCFKTERARVFLRCSRCLCFWQWFGGAVYLNNKGVVGPTAVFRSAAKMDHIKTGGTLLNMKFTPSLIEGDEGIETLRHLVRGYFAMDGHHVQFNVVDADTLREAQADPDSHRDLIVRVAGYSDYFCDLSDALQEEIIERTAHAEF